MDDQLKCHVVEHFTRLCSIDRSIVGSFLCWGHFFGLSVSFKNGLEGLVSDDEIRLALFGMALLKASRVDRYHAKFYQLNWKVVGPFICAMVRNVFEGNQLDPLLNRTRLILIPKVVGLEQITQFRPISLCTVL